MDAPTRLVLYDGVCGLCDRTVQWLLRNDPAGELTFAPLQGPTAQAILARHPEVPAGVDSVLFVEMNANAERVLWRSAAIFAMSKYLQTGWRRLSWLGAIPAAITDLGYRIIAAIRYRIWGELDQCRVPSAEERTRFLP